MMKAFLFLVIATTLEAGGMPCCGTGCFGTPAPLASAY